MCRLVPSHTRAALLAAPLQLCYSPNNEVLVSGGYDAAVKVWDCRSRSIDPIQVMRPFRDSVTSVAVTERCAQLALRHCCMPVPGVRRF